MRFVSTIEYFIICKKSMFQTFYVGMNPFKARHSIFLKLSLEQYYLHLMLILRKVYYRNGQTLFMFQPKGKTF